MDARDDAILSRELERIRAELARVPFGTVSVSFTLHDGKISRVARGIEISEKAGEPTRHFAAGRGGG